MKIVYWLPILFAVISVYSITTLNLMFSLENKHLNIHQHTKITISVWYKLYYLVGALFGLIGLLVSLFAINKMKKNKFRM